MSDVEIDAATIDAATRAVTERIQREMAAEVNPESAPVEVVSRDEEPVVVREVKPVEAEPRSAMVTQESETAVAEASAETPRAVASIDPEKASVPPPRIKETLPLQTEETPSAAPIHGEPAEALTARSIEVTGDRLTPATLVELPQPSISQLEVTPITAADQIEADTSDQPPEMLDWPSLEVTAPNLETLLAPIIEHDEAEVALISRLEDLEPAQIESVRELVEELASIVEVLSLWEEETAPVERQVVIERLEVVVTELLENLGLEADEKTVKQIIAQYLKPEAPESIDEMSLSIEARNRLGTREYKPLAPVLMRPQAQAHQRLGVYTLRACAA